MLHGARFLHAPTALSNRPSQAHVGDQPLLLPGGLPSLAAPPLPSVLPSPCWAPWCVRVSCLFVRHAPLPACAFGCVCFPFAYPGCCLVSSGGLFCSLGDWAGAGGREVWGRCGCRRCARRLQVGRRDTEAARCALGRQGGVGAWCCCCFCSFRFSSASASGSSRAVSFAWSPGLLPLACLGFCVVSSRVRFLVRGALPRTAEWARVFFLSLCCCCFALLAC